MAKQRNTPSGGRALVIVESPAKARTIGKFLGRNFTVEASIGHIRDLPEGKKQIPAPYRDEEWAYLGVDVKREFQPVYIVPPGKHSQVKKLRDLVKEASSLYLATDEDREGEAISWHLAEVLKPKVPVHRMVFHEITQEAIQEALSNCREIDEDLVRAQETRRIVDRLYGYDVSPLLWRKLGRRLSAGRVQSVAVRLIVDRERERMRFVTATFFDLLAEFAKRSGESFNTTLVTVDGKKLPSTGDFDPATGRIKDPSLAVLSEADAAQLVERLRRGEFRIGSVESKPETWRPAPPFTTSTLQQEANRKLGFTARRTMQAAQSLYENGHITYMRTDSTNLAKVAIEAARDLVSQQYGPEFLPSAPREYASKVKNAQEAHEAIRPAGHPFDFPEALRASLREDEFRLYDLIWKRTVASQMADARVLRTTITVEAAADSTTAVFRASGKVIEFPGYLRAYVEGSDDPQAELAERDSTLPALTVGESVHCRNLEPKSHTTQPPARYTEATLTKELEGRGIGRPSTYASIIDTILAREYVWKKGNALVPTWVAFAVSQLLEAHLPDLVDYEFTARMEDDLDAISRGESGHVDYLKGFYYGREKNGEPGLRPQLDARHEDIDVRAVSRIHIGTPAEGDFLDPINVRVGRYGPFLEQGERRAPIPDGMAPDEVTITFALDQLSRAAHAEEPLGHCPETGEPIFFKQGRFGPYVQRGRPDGEEKPKSASLLRGMSPDQIDLATALQLLSLPRNLGPHPTSGDDVVAQNGRFGPYIKCGAETRSLPATLSPLDVTMEQALELLAQPKAVRRGFGQARTPLKTLDASPVTGQPVLLFEGRYGMYVTDGTTNASLPKGETAEALTLEQALALLAARAALGPPKKKAGRRAAAARPKSAKVPAGKKPAARAKAAMPEGASGPAPKRAAKKAVAKKATKRPTARKPATREE